MEENKFYIYIIKNTLNNKVYIGKSNKPQIRWRTHIKVSRGGKELYPNDFFYLHAALAKHGINNFTFEIIEEFNDSKSALDAEILWIKKFNSFKREFGYNLTLGGDGDVPSEETKLKMSLAQQGEKHSQAKLTEKDVLEILEKYSSGNYSQNKLADEYKISQRSISDILQHRTWTHLTKDFIYIPGKTQGRPGELSKNNKLTEDEVINIIKLYNTNQYTYKDIAKIFNVKSHTIGAIIRGTNWKHVKRD